MSSPAEAAAVHQAVPEFVTYMYLALLVGMIVSLALEDKLHAKKSMITGIFAAVCLLLGEVDWVNGMDILPDDPHPIATLPGGFQVHLPVYIAAIEWDVIAIIVGSSLFIDVVSRSGIFSWTAIRLTKISGGDPVKLLVYYSILTVVFSAVLNNVTAMIIVGSLTVVSLDKLDKRDLLLGFLLTQGLLTNVGGLLTLISSVPNIILGSAGGIEFVTFFLVAAPYVVVATAMTVFMAVKIFKIPPLRTEEEKQEAAKLVSSFDESDGIESTSFFNLSWLLLAGFILTIATTSILPIVSELGMGYVAISFALLAMLKYKNEVDRNYAALDWDLLAFFAFLFVVISTMEHAGVLGLIGAGIGKLIALPEIAGGSSLLWSGAIASSMTDNVPLAAVMG
ncbi:MAG: hypothetical protein KJO07_01570, partial [Deltaproteobacteria bacterium]|nr:hypothetical protein [Deltaproteobacteria bacterium]